MGLKDDAQKAWEKQQAENTQLQREKAAEAATLALDAFGRMFGDWRPAVDGTSLSTLQYMIDGLTLRYITRNGAFVMKGECPECGVQCWGGQDIRSLVDLGSVLERFIPNHGHLCPAAAETLTWEERMKVLIREALEE